MNPIINIKTAWEIMNAFDEHSQPIPFSVSGTSPCEDPKNEKYGKVFHYDNMIMLRNQKYIGNTTNEPSKGQEMIYDRNWMLFNTETKQTKSISYWHLSFLNGMEIN